MTVGVPIPSVESPGATREPTVSRAEAADNLSTPLELVPAKCLCGEDDAEPLAVGQDFHSPSRLETFLAVRCRNCGLVYLNPSPAVSQLHRIARTSTDPESSLRHGMGAWRQGATWKRQLAGFCRSLPEEARVLDLSSAEATQLCLIGHIAGPGWRLERVCSDYHRIDEIELPRDAYDAVFLINVLEGAVDPIAILKLVGRLLRSDGIALVATPNIGSAAFKFFRGRHWSGYDFPRHRNLFCPEALAHSAAMAGLEVVSLSTSPAPSAWIQSARIMLSDWTAPRWALTTLDKVWGIALSAAAGIEWLSQMRTEGGVLIATVRRAG